MIHYISGKVVESAPSLVVIETGGVGFGINTSLTSARSVKEGQQAVFYTHMNVREDVLELYGFSTKEELSCFRRLISVSGVGPKAAISILGVVTPEGLTMCIISNDEKKLTAAPGIGKKIAQRIILELKDKMSAEGLTAVVGDGVQEIVGGTAFEDAVAALAVLGFPRAAAMKALQGVDFTDLGTDELVRVALKNLL